MTAEIIKLLPAEIGDDYRFDSDEVLENSKGQIYTSLVIIGLLEDGSTWVSGNSNVGEVLLLMERAKHNLVFGGDE